MNTTSPPHLESSERAPRRINERRGILRVAAPYRWPVYLACTALAVATGALLGKDMAWDMLNYQVYAGFSAVNDRFAQDYFAAGPQSYFNPYAYVPFYGLMRSGLPSLAISSLLAVMHSAILWLTFELALSVCPSNDPRMRAITGVCAVALAFVNPILMQQLGSSFADVTTAELVLAGWLLLAGTVKSPRAGPLISAGLLLGAASALKLTNSVHAIAGIAVLVWIPLSWRGRIRQCVLLISFLSLGFLIVAAPWSYRLEEMFGNPLFPLANNIFRSPEFTTEPLSHFRFIPPNLIEALWRPFAMIDPVRMVHEELSAPDPRYAALVVLGCVLFGRWLWRRRTQSVNVSAGPGPDPTARILAALSCGLAVDWVLWLSASGNGRYFLPMASVAAVVIVALLFRFFKPKVRNYILVVIFLSQTVQLSMGAEFRWTDAPWGDRWFNIAMPQKLAVESNLYLTIGMQSNSFIAPFLAAGSGMINFSGNYTPLANDGANGARVEALIHRYEPNLRVLLQGAGLYDGEDRRQPRRSHADDALSRFGLRVDAGDCATIAVQGLPPEIDIGFKSSEPNDQQHRDTTYLVSCKVVRDTADHSAMLARQHAVDLVLDRLEDTCPELLQPRRARTEHDGDDWQRLYMNTDLKVSVSNGWVKIRDPIRGYALIYAGREMDWARTPIRLACGRGATGYFAKMAQSK
jgi:hypothetical protein